MSVSFNSSLITTIFKLFFVVALPGNVYTADSLECTPPDLYLNDNIRVYAKEHRLRARSANPTVSSTPQRSPSSISPSTSLTRRRRVQSADVAYRFGNRVRLPEQFADNEYLTHEGLTMGQKQYIWGIARCYSMENLKLLNERRLKSILDYELDKRMKTPTLCRDTKENLLREYKKSTKVIERKTVSVNPWLQRTRKRWVLV